MKVVSRVSRKVRSQKMAQCLLSPRYWAILTPKRGLTMTAPRLVAGATQKDVVRDVGYDIGCAVSVWLSFISIH